MSLPPGDSPHPTVVHATPAGQQGATPCRLPRRLLAMLYDALLLGSVLFLATLVVLPLTRGEAIRPGNPYYGTYLLGISYLYFAWPWIHGGQTLGMRAWGILIVRAGGGAPRIRDTLLRFGGALISWLLLGSGFLYAAADPQARTLHDILSGTRLIRVK